ncbi:MAG TPA: universal stress protein [Acidimicrobiia bacterium]|jgi:nucleotide-binding universal stress UspA family protein
MFKTIVVGTDGSEGAMRAVQVAADLASSQGDGVMLHIVSVQKPMAATAMASGELAVSGAAAAGAEWEQDVRRSLEGTLDQSARDAERAGVTIETHARFGNPAEVLCDLAGHLQADLIVVGNRGMQGGRRFLGSVPNTISHHSPCSVLIADTQ